MKIAVITEDGKSISQHFGQTPNYLVAIVEDGKKVLHQAGKPCRDIEYPKCGTKMIRE